jgi:hypothetical protein
MLLTIPLSRTASTPALIPIGHMTSLNKCNFHGKYGMHFWEDKMSRQPEPSDFKLDLVLTSGKVMTVGLEVQRQDTRNSVYK